MEQVGTQTIASFTGTLLKRERALEERFVQLVFREDDKDWLCISTDPQTAKLSVGQNYRIEGVFKQRGDRAFVYEPKIALLKKHWRPIRRIIFVVSLFASVAAMGGVAYMHQHESSSAPSSQTVPSSQTSTPVTTTVQTQSSNATQPSTAQPATQPSPATVNEALTPTPTAASPAKHTTPKPKTPVSTTTASTSNQGSDSQAANTTPTPDDTGTTAPETPTPPVGPSDGTPTDPVPPQDPAPPADQNLDQNPAS